MTDGRSSLGKALRTSNPSIPGICTSRKTTSGESSRIFLTAEEPSPHSPMTSTSLNFFNRSATPRRAKGSSSTISARTRLLLVLLELPCEKEFRLRPHNRPCRANATKIAGCLRRGSANAPLYLQGQCLWKVYRLGRGGGWFEVRNS